MVRNFEDIREFIKKKQKEDEFLHQQRRKKYLENQEKAKIRNLEIERIQNNFLNNVSQFRIVVLDILENFGEIVWGSHVKVETLKSGFLRLRKKDIERTITNYSITEELTNSRAYWEIKNRYGSSASTLEEAKKPRNIHYSISVESSESGEIKYVNIEADAEYSFMSYTTSLGSSGFQYTSIPSYGSKITKRNNLYSSTVELNREQIENELSKAFFGCQQT